MAPNHHELIELWDRADRACEEAHQVAQEIRSRIETIAGLLAERREQSVDTRALVARSRALLRKSMRLRIL